MHSNTTYSASIIKRLGDGVYPVFKLGVLNALFYGYNFSIASFCSCSFISSASYTGQVFWLSDEKKVLFLKGLNIGESSKRFIYLFNNN